MEVEFKNRFQISDWDRSEEDSSRPLRLRNPFRALVKDLVEVEQEVTADLVKIMLRDLKALHGLKIYVMDISIENYKGGKLVDFSSAYTVPHVGLLKGIRSDLAISQAKGQDNYDFDQMIEELSIDTSIRARPIPPWKLRPRTKKPRYS
jgi:hypothetical protein